MIVLSGFTQTLDDTVKCYTKAELQAISIALINGSECHELLFESNKEIKLLEESIEIVETKCLLCDSALSKSNDNNKILQKDNASLNTKREQESKKKRVWRSVAVAAIIGDAILRTILILKK